VTFPSLSITPNFPLRETEVDNTIRSNFEGGYELTRPRFTRRRRVFSFSYKYLPENDVNLLKSFYNQVGCYKAFNWTHPRTGEVITVRFTKPLNFEYVAPGYWNIDIELREV